MSKNILTLIIIILFASVIILKKRIRFLRVYSETRMKEREAVISFLHKIGERITHSIDLQGSLEIITNFIVEYTHAESGAIFLLNEEENALRAKVVIGLFPPLHQTTEHAFTKRKFLTERIMRDKVNLGEGIIGYVAQSGITQLITDPQNDPRVPQTSDVSIASLMVAPLKIKDKVLGVMALANKRDGISFDERDKSLLESLSDQAAVTVDIVKLYDQLAKQQRIEQELRVAHDFQKLLLPKECPSVEGLDMAAISEPALEVGGDYYDFFWVDEDHLGVVIADVSGKGIPGALVMSMLRSALRAESRNILSPAAVLKVINEYIRTDTQVNVFITAIYAIIDIRTHKILFARAGHEPLVIFTDGGKKHDFVAPNGIALGMVGEDIFNITENREITLAEGDTIVLYTDGVVEAMNKASEEYGQQRLLKTANRSLHGKAKEVLDAVMADIREFSGDLPQHDDITMIVIKVKALMDSVTSRAPVGSGTENLNY